MKNHTTLLTAALMAFCGSVYAFSPANNERVEISSKVLKLSWQGEPEKTYRVEIFLGSEDKIAQIVKVRGTSYLINFKKIPPVFFWRVHDGEKKSEKFRVYLYKAPTLSLSVFTGVSRSHFSFSSNLVNRSETVSGHLKEIHLDYRPSYFGRKFSFSLNARNSLLDNHQASLTENRVGLEIGYHKLHHSRFYNAFYVGYLAYNHLDINFEGLKSDYDVNFFTLRHFFRVAFYKNLEFEMASALQFESSFDSRLSYSFKPLAGYRIGQNWRLDSFVFYESYASNPREENFSRDVRISYSNLGVGIGMTYRN